MKSLVGTWELLNWTASVGDRVQRPFNGAAVGRLTYTADGFMWATLMRKDRPLVSTPTLAGATATERAAVAAGYLNYAGRYTVFDHRVIHHVEVALLPNWVGQDQERIVSWLGEDLELSTDPEPGLTGGPIVNRLHWTRL